MSSSSPYTPHIEGAVQPRRPTLCKIAADLQPVIRALVTPVNSSAKGVNGSSGLLGEP